MRQIELEMNISQLLYVSNKIFVDVYFMLGLKFTLSSRRYGEKAEEMEALDDWKCPKCRGICNCSFCMYFFFLNFLYMAPPIYDFQLC